MNCRMPVEATASCQRPVLWLQHKLIAQCAAQVPHAQPVASGEAPDSPGMRWSNVTWLPCLPAGASSEQAVPDLISNSTEASVVPLPGICTATTYDQLWPELNRLFLQLVIINHASLQFPTPPRCNRLSCCDRTAAAPQAARACCACCCKCIKGTPAR